MTRRPSEFMPSSEPRRESPAPLAPSPLQLSQDSSLRGALHNMFIYGELPVRHQLLAAAGFLALAFGSATGLWYVVNTDAFDRGMQVTGCTWDRPLDAAGAVLDGNFGSFIDSCDSGR